METGYALAGWLTACFAGLIALSTAQASQGPEGQSGNGSSMLGGWLKTTPSLEDMIRGKDPKLAQQLAYWANILNKNPNDVTALDNAGYIALQFSQDKRTPLTRWADWQLVAAKNLERAIQLNPKDYYAWHNYGELNFEAGDLWMLGDHSNARRAVMAFTEAISPPSKGPGGRRAWDGPDVEPNVPVRRRVSGHHFARETECKRKGG